MMPATKEVDVNFNSILIGSEDPAALSAFYTKVLGEPTYTDES